jgi:hypothetical protein
MGVKSHAYMQIRILMLYEKMSVGLYTLLAPACGNVVLRVERDTTLVVKKPVSYVSKTRPAIEIKNF